jgi:hypothetical protein
VPGGLLTLNPSYGVTVRGVIAAAPDREGGVGGFQASERAGRRPAKWFKSQPDDTVSWDLILDSDATPGRYSVTERLRHLRDMGVAHSDHDEPPTIDLSGDVWDTDANIPWVIENITLGDRLYDPFGEIRQHHVTVQLSRFEELDEVNAISIRRTRTGKKNKKRRHTIVTRAGDTMRSVALRELGSGNRWKDLRHWNKKQLGKVNPDDRLRAGTHLAVH